MAQVVGRDNLRRALKRVLSEAKNILEDMDAWLRRRMRCLLWRQWKRPRTRFKKMVTLGLERERAAKSAWNGRGPWWNAGDSTQRHLRAFIRHL